MEIESVNVYLKSEAIIRAQYEIDEYDDIYDSWLKHDDRQVNFSNCTIVSSEIAAMEWSNDNEL